MAISNEQNELFEKIKPGQRWRLWFGTGHHNNKLYHVRGIVDDKIILRYWMRFRWNYVMENVWFFYFGIERKHLTLLETKAKSDNPNNVKNY